MMETREYKSTKTTKGTLGRWVIPTSFYEMKTGPRNNEA